MGKIQKIFGKEVIEQKAIDQLENCLIEDSIGVLSADAHLGYSCPVGGIVAYKDKVSPSGVGYDIACGNCAIETGVLYEDIKSDIKSIMTQIVKNIGFGVGRPTPKPIDHPVFDIIAHSGFEPQRNFLDLAKRQLATVGGGNHFIDIFRDVDTDRVWVANHFGSRGFGHKTASGFIAMSQGLEFTDRHKEAAMNAAPILFDMNSYIGEAYWEAMSVAGAYAYAGRETVLNEVLRIMNISDDQRLQTVHNHHNFAWKENHNGEDYIVVRKGATPARPGQKGFIGSNMSDISVIIEGIDGQESRDGLYSTVHGAGRVLSRTQATGKQKWMRDELTGKKRPVRVSEGLVNFEETKAKMKLLNIELRGAGADEAPQCYKKLEDILKYHSNTIKVLNRLQPVGVAMAGSNKYDPYRD